MFVCMFDWARLSGGKKWSHIFPYINFLFSFILDVCFFLGGGVYTLLCHRDSPTFRDLYCPCWLWFVVLTLIASFLYMLFWIYKLYDILHHWSIVFTYKHTISVYCCVSHKWAWRQGNKWSVLDDHWTTYLILEKPCFRIIILKLILLNCFLLVLTGPQFCANSVGDGVLFVLMSLFITVFDKLQ